MDSQSKSRSTNRSTSTCTSNPQKRIKLTLSSPNPPSDNHRTFNAMNGENGSSSRRQRQTRMMDVKVLYTLESNPQQTMVARLGSQAPIPIQHGPTAKSPDRPWFGTITLKTCLSAICGASPELVFDRSRDYVLYAVDPIETYRSSKSNKSSSSSHSNSHTSPGSSKYRQSSYLVGKSMFNWGLQEPGDGHTMVTGRVCVTGGRRSDDYDSEDEEMMSDEDEEEEEEEEILEVVLKLRETESRSKEQYYDAVKGFSSASNNNNNNGKPSNGGSSSRPNKSRSISSRQKEMVEERETTVEGNGSVERSGNNKTRNSKRRKLDNSQPPNAIQPLVESSSRPKSNSRLSIRRTTSNPLQSESSPANSFLDIGALASSSSPPFDPSRHHSASPAASISMIQRPPQAPVPAQEVRPEQAQQLLQLLHAVGEQARQPGAESNPFQQNQAHLVQVLSSLAGALGAPQSTGTPISSSGMTPSGNESEIMPPPSLPFNSSSSSSSSTMTSHPTQPQTTSSNSLSSLLYNSTLPTSTSTPMIPPSVSFTAPSSGGHLLQEPNGNNPMGPLFEASSPQDWSFLLSSLENTKEDVPPSPASETSARSTTTANTNNNNGQRTRKRRKDKGKPEFGSSEEICYNCGQTDMLTTKGNGWRTITIPQDEKVNQPSAYVNWDPSGKGKGRERETDLEDEDDHKCYRSCKLCLQYRTRRLTNRPQRIWLPKGGVATPATASSITPSSLVKPSPQFKRQTKNSHVPVFDFKDGNGASRIGARGIKAGGIGGRSFVEVGLKRDGRVSKQLSQLCESRETANSSVLEKEKEKESSSEKDTEMDSDQGNEKEKEENVEVASLNERAKKRGGGRPRNPPPPAPRDPSLPMPWSSAVAQPVQLPDPMFDKSTGERTRGFVRQQSQPVKQLQQQPEAKPTKQPPPPPPPPQIKASNKKKTSKKASDSTFTRSSSSKAVHFGQSSPVRPSISARATFSGVSGSSPVGRTRISGSNSFLQSSPGFNRIMSDCDYDFGSISFPGLGQQGTLSLEDSPDMNMDNFGLESFGETESMRLLRRSPRKLPSGTKNKNNPYASSVMAIPASPTFSLSRNGSNLGLNRQGGGPASMDVLTSSVSPMTRSRTKSSSNGIHPAMLSSSIGRRVSNSGKKQDGSSSDNTSPGSPTPSSQVRSGGSRRNGSNKRKAVEDLVNLESPNLDLGLWTWDNQDEEEEDDGKAQELEASPSSSRRNRRGSKSAQSSELSRGPSSTSNFLGSSTSNQKMKSARLGNKTSTSQSKKDQQDEEDAFFNTSNPPGSSPSIFEIALQNRSAKSPAATTSNKNQDSRAKSNSNPVVTPKEREPKGFNMANAFKHLREESSASAQSPLWGGETPASDNGEVIGTAEPPPAPEVEQQKDASKVESSQALTTQVQSAPPRVARKPLPATVEDAPSSSGGDSPYDDDDYMDQEPSPAESGLFEGFEDPYGLLAASGIGLNPTNANASTNQTGINVSSDTFREAIELYASREFGTQLRDFTQNGGTGIAAHINPNASGSNQPYGEIQGAVLRDGQAQIESTSSNENRTQLPSTPGRSRTLTSSNYFPTGLTPGMTPINLSAFNQINASGNPQALPSHFHTSSTNASPGILNSLLNDPSWKELLSSFVSPQKSKGNGNQAQIMAAEDENGEGEGVASGSGSGRVGK